MLIMTVNPAHGASASVEIANSKGFYMKIKVVISILLSTFAVSPGGVCGKGVVKKTKSIIVHSAHPVLVPLEQVLVQPSDISKNYHPEFTKGWASLAVVRDAVPGVKSKEALRVFKFLKSAKRIDNKGLVVSEIMGFEVLVAQETGRDGFLIWLAENKIPLEDRLSVIVSRVSMLTDDLCETLDNGVHSYVELEGEANRTVRSWMESIATMKGTKFPYPHNGQNSSTTLMDIGENEKEEKALPSP